MSTHGEGQIEKLVFVYIGIMRTRMRGIMNEHFGKQWRDRKTAAAMARKQHRKSEKRTQHEPEQQ